MKVDYIALSIPVFFLLIGVELLYSVVKNLKLYRLNDSIANISLGVGQQITGIFMKTAVFFGYLFLYENYRFATVGNSVLVWVILFFGVDFFYYWFHRMSHEVNALWAAHIVHHQSEDYNLSVALRQSWFQNAFSWAFYLPLAFAGFDPIMFLTISSFNTLYQFWIHTRTINKMGILEWFLNTPSHHRVHHGSDPEYIDKNHGGTLIIWDRLFGTFREEKKEPHYGITTPLKSWNPVWANFHYWIELLNAASKSTGIKNKILVFLKPPGWMPDELGGFQFPKVIDDKTYQKYDNKPSSKINFYLLAQFIMILLLSILVLFKQKDLSMIQMTMTAAYIIFSLAVCGTLFEVKKYGVTLEYARLLSTPLLLLVFSENENFNAIMISVLTYSLISVFSFYFANSISKPQISTS